jgi:hypothetical protein
MSMRMCRVSVLGVVLATGLAVAACSSAPAGSKASAKLMPQMQAAIEGATSVHMAGTVDDGSQVITIDMSFSGPAMAGTVGSNGGSFDFLVLNGKTFVKLDATFLKHAKAPPSVCAKVCGKYVEIPAASASQITGALSMHQLMSHVFSNKSISSAAASGCVFSPATVNGRLVLQCLDGGYTVDVAAHGKPYPVYLTGPHGQRIEFSDWNAVTLPAAPPASQVVSIPNLG